jgi:hypothetical protein
LTFLGQLFFLMAQQLGLAASIFFTAYQLLTSGTLLHSLSHAFRIGLSLGGSVFPLHESALLAHFHLNRTGTAR